MPLFQTLLDKYASFVLLPVSVIIKYTLTYYLTKDCNDYNYNRLSTRTTVGCIHLGKLDVLLFTVSSLT